MRVPHYFIFEVRRLNPTTKKFNSVRSAGFVVVPTLSLAANTLLNRPSLLLRLPLPDLYGPNAVPIRYIGLPATEAGKRGYHPTLIALFKRSRSKNSILNPRATRT